MLIVSIMRAPLWLFWSATIKIAKCTCILWHSAPFSSTLSTPCSDFKVICHVWNEAIFQCNDNTWWWSIHSSWLPVIRLSVTNVIHCHISSIGWWVPFQCHWSLVCVCNHCQVFNWVRSEKMHTCIVNGLVVWVSLVPRLFVRGEKKSLVSTVRTCA